MLKNITIQCNEGKAGCGEGDINILSAYLFGDAGKLDNIDNGEKIQTVNGIYKINYIIGETDTRITWYPDEDDISDFSLSKHTVDLKEGMISRCPQCQYDGFYLDSKDGKAKCNKCGITSIYKNWKVIDTKSNTYETYHNLIRYLREIIIDSACKHYPDNAHAIFAFWDVDRIINKPHPFFPEKSRKQDELVFYKIYSIPELLQGITNASKQKTKLKLIFVYENNSIKMLKYNKHIQIPWST